MLNTLPYLEDPYLVGINTATTTTQPIKYQTEYIGLPNDSKSKIGQLLIEILDHVKNEDTAIHAISHVYNKLKQIYDKMPN